MSSFDSYDEDFDTYDFSGSFDDDACEPHVEKSLARSKMKHSEVANRCLSMRVALCALPDVREPRRRASRRSRALPRRRLRR